jgi:hypothetical protein
LSEEVHRDVSLSGPEKDDILALPDIGTGVSAVGPDLDPDSMGSLDPYPDPDPGGQKYVLLLAMIHKNRKS